MSSVAQSISLRTSLLLPLLVVGNSTAAILVGPQGTGSLTFDSRPAASNGWTTLGAAGSSSDIVSRTQLEALVQQRTVAEFTTALETTAITNPVPPVNGLARWNSSGRYVQSVPGGVAATFLLATLQNDTGSDVSTLTVSYDFGALTAPGAVSVETVPGLLVYSSLTGEAGSWQTIPEFSTDLPGPLTAHPDLGAWPAGAFLYLLWADDNGPGDTGVFVEVAYTIDNFVADARPSLSITRTSPTQVEVAWPFPSTGYELQRSSTLPATNWQRLTNAPVSNGGYSRLVVDAVSGTAFFRLEKR